LWAELPLSPDVIQFHSDEVGTLPPSAKLLASSPACENQAFRIGSNCYAVQFHIETTADVVLGWAANSPDKTAVAPAHFSLERMTTAHQDIAETWQPFAERFVRLAAGELSPAPGVPLPLV
jgi:hypothetical protein